MEKFVFKELKVCGEIGVSYMGLMRKTHPVTLIPFCLTFT